MVARKPRRRTQKTSPAPLIWAPKSSEPSLSLIGEKAFGLTCLPDLVPQYTVLTTEWNKRSGGRPDPDHPRSWFVDRCSGEEWEAVVAQLAVLIDGAGAGGLYVRVSLPNEPIEQRGQTETSRCTANLDAVCASASELLHRNGSANEPAAVIIQIGVLSVVRGHMSNERRVTEEQNSWLIELEQETHQPKKGQVRIKVDPQNWPSDHIETARGDFETSLQLLAAWAAGAPFRWHFEWVFDGDKLFVVQADTVKPISSAGNAAPGEYWLNRSIPHAIGPFRILRKISPGEEIESTLLEYPKLKAVASYRALGLPTIPFYVLTDQAEWKLLKSGKISEPLTRDLHDVLAGPVVCRTDIKGESFSMNLPRSDTLLDESAARRFLLEEAAPSPQLSLESQPCAILHRFIPARAGAFAAWYPDRKNVRIDATWGPPESLSTFSHDSYLVDNATGKITRRRIRCKGRYIDIREDGEWVETSASRVWDWQPVLSPAEAKRIAQIASAVGQREGHACQVMFFTQVPPVIALDGIFPWVTQPLVGGGDEVGGDPDGLRPAPKVANADDLRKLIAANSGQTKLHRVRFVPNAADLRFRDKEKNVIMALGDAAAKENVAIEIVGSTLSHTYYLLRQRNARVIAINPFDEREDQTLEFKKLVRDFVPAKIRSAGEGVDVVRVTGEAKLGFLRSKLLEEAHEVFNASSNDELLQELADVLGVLDALAESAGANLEKIHALATEKKEVRGGFDKGTVLIRTRSRPSPESPQQGLSLEPSLDEVGQTASLMAMAERPSLQRGDTVVVPLVPPDPAFRQEIFRIPVMRGKLVAFVRYEGRRAYVQLRETEDSPEQLSLGATQAT